MDAAGSMTPIQLLLFGTLLALLALWMITFLVLALRPNATKSAEGEDESITYHEPSLSTPAPMMMRVVKVQQAQVPVMKQSEF